MKRGQEPEQQYRGNQAEGRTEAQDHAPWAVPRRGPAPPSIERRPRYRRPDRRDRML